MEHLVIALIVALCAVHVVGRILAIRNGSGSCGHCDGCPKCRGQARCDVLRKEDGHVV